MYEGNLRVHALRLDGTAIDRTKSNEVRSRARSQAKRARKFDQLLQHAYRRSKPVRLVLLEGERRSESELGLDASKVAFRSLDAVPWYVHSYDDADGSFRMVRGLPAGGEPVPLPEEPKAPEFVDQFSAPEPPERQAATGTVFERSKGVRDIALRLAAGVCDACGQPGFKLDSGAIFLETHHVVPLSENGPDVEWNVVALCPNDHRRAHYGADRMEMRRRLADRLAARYPQAAEKLSQLIGEEGE